MNLADFSSERIQLYLLVFVRLTAIMSLLPIFGSAGVSPQMRVGFSFLLAVIIGPFVHFPAHAVLPSNLPQFVFAVARETFVGISIGFCTSFLFASVQFAGQLIDSETGFSMIDLIDPLNEAGSVTVTGQLKMLIFSMLFLLLNGHFFLILAAQKSFEVIPLMQANLPFGPLSQHFSGMVSDVFVLGLRFAAPVYVILTLTSLAFAILARTVPQMNVFYVGMPVKIFVGLASLAIVLPILAVLFKEMLQHLVVDIYKVIYLMA